MVTKNTGSGVTLPRFTSQPHPHHCCDLGRLAGSLCLGYLINKMRLRLSEVMRVNVKYLIQYLICSKYQKMSLLAIIIITLFHC